MKQLLPLVFALVVSVFSTQHSNAQLFVNSDKGYTAIISVKVLEIVPKNIQPSGYNYDLRISYSVSFSGANIPHALYNLRGTLGCGSQSFGFGLPLSTSSGTVMTENNQWKTGSPAGATPATLACQNINIIISGDGISSRTLAMPAPSVLPVTMSSFTASFDFNKVSLNWSTASEENNAFFTIERAADGINYKAIGKVDGSLNSTTIKSYQFTDLAPLTGTSYYRIRQTDLDGQSTISEIKTVKNSGTAKSIGLYPVPNTGNNITVTGIRDYSNHTIAVVNASGSVVFQANMTAASVELPRLNNGFYFIRISDKTTGEVNNIRYIKN